MADRYQVIRYSDGEALGIMEMSEEVFEGYMEDAQQPEGIITLDRLAWCIYDGLPAEFDEVDGDTTIYLTAL